VSPYWCYIYLPKTFLKSFHIQIPFLSLLRPHPHHHMYNPFDFHDQFFLQPIIKFSSYVAFYQHGPVLHFMKISLQSNSILYSKSKNIWRLGLSSHDKSLFRVEFEKKKSKTEKRNSNVLGRNFFNFENINEVWKPVKF
jgi:hypothetical protein